MSSFTRYDADLNIQYHHEASRILGKDHWVVTSPFVYFVNSIDSGIYVPVHTGYLTDGATVPRLLWNLIPPWGSYGQAAVVHDFLCDYGMVQTKDGAIAYNRKQIDNVFYEALEVLNVSKAKIRTMKAGVDTYRTICRPKVPNITSDKKNLEELLLRKYRETGSFHL